MACIDDLDGKFSGLSFVIVLVLHEDHIANLKTVNEELDGGAEVSSSGPDILDEGDFFWIYFELFREPVVVEFHTLFFEVYELSWFVENLIAHHHES